MKRNQSELVSPAGDWPSLRAAVDSGADSVYFGVTALNMRATATNFDIAEMRKVMRFLHDHRKKGYLTLNTVIMNDDVKKARAILRAARSADVDAVILWDMGLLLLAREIGLRVHLSTQASVSHSDAVLFYAKLGVRRIVLARECTLGDIRRIARFIKKKRLQCEIECFVHGALCVGISGRCFLSHHAFARSANKGQCLQPCRREFLIQDADGESEYILGRDYLLSPKDLCTIEFIDELMAAGVHAFKIEGRMRSPEYVKVVTAVYRQAIDACGTHTLSRPLKQRLKNELSSVYNRGFSHGFYFGQPGSDAMSSGLEHTHEKVFLGEVAKFYKKISVADIILRSAALAKGDQLLFIGKRTPAHIARVEELQHNHVPVVKAEKGQRVGVRLPFIVWPKDKVFIWKRRR